ncbi:nuclear pore complex subunit [Tieghemiomyces parasiticus]|uniref:Nuclear pore protein n=1 Tax=Tieghemiomyces parasiticus TaxID=78921 RepID=A0A9W8AI04_9FUNG|nr:nuclear pore complex subunit [Tieghemiomyces parasiticus]
MLQTNPSRLKQLLDESQQLTTHITPSDLPTIQRGLDQIEAESRRLVSRTILETQGLDTKGHFLLASGGVDPERLSQAVHSFDLAAAFEPVQTVPETDVESYLQYQREQLIINAIESGYRETCQDFEAAHERAYQADWSRTKTNLLDELCQRPGGAPPGARAQPLPSAHRRLGRRATHSGAGTGSSNLQLTPRMRQYARAIQALNDQRLRGADCAVVALFEGVARSLTGEDHSEQMVTGWGLLATILDERVAVGGEDGSQTLTEAEFSAPYLQSDYYAVPNVQVRNHFIRGARRYLEEQFVQYLDRTLAQHPREASLGGLPTIHRKVQAFLKLKLARADAAALYLERDGSQAVWAHMYYLFRAGYVDQALQYAMKHETFLVQSERNFLTYLKAYVDDEDRRLPRALQDRLQADFNRYNRNPHDGLDPFKFALLKIVGRCELTRKSVPEVVQATEDYVWLQLVLIREPLGPEETNDDRYTLRDLQKLLVNFGPAHFNPHGNNPALYFQVLLLSAQFEQAVNYLLQLETYRVEAVHFAVALAYYGLLRLTPLDLPVGNLEYLTVVDGDVDRDVPCLNFNRVIEDYTTQFADADGPAALHYVFLFCLHSLTRAADEPRAKYQATLAHDAVLDVLAGAREYGPLLGEIQRDGARHPGFLERYLPLLDSDPQSSLLTRLTKETAELCRQDGRLGDAILLYNMAEEYDTVVAILNVQLGEILSNPLERQRLPEANGAESLTFAARDGALGLSTAALTAGTLAPGEVKRMTEGILDHYLSQAHIQAAIQPRHKETCVLLLSLLDFMAAYEAGRLDQALHIMERLHLIPLEADVVTITRQAEQLRDLDEAIARNFPDLLLATMDVLCQLYTQTKQSQFLDASKQSQLALLRKKGRSLMVLAGMIQFRMPPDTYARLNRLDVFMH